MERGHGKSHRTLAEILEVLVSLVLRWFPERTFRFSADGNIGTHRLARFTHRHRERLSLVSRFYANANLYEPPPATRGIGRPRAKGRKMPSPAEIVQATTKHTRLRVNWHGKTLVTFSDVMTGLRRWLWRRWAFATPRNRTGFRKLPRSFQDTLLESLAPAA